MDKSRETELLSIIDEALVELSEISGATHISAYIINGSVSIEDYTELKKPKFSYYRGRANNGKNTKCTTDSI